MSNKLITFIVLALTLTLSGCGAGTTASTRQVSQVTDGVEGAINVDGNNIRVVNLLVVATQGGNGVLVGTVINTKDEEDALLGVAINGTVVTYTGTNALPKNSPVVFEGESANAKAVLSGFGATPGSRVPVTMFFARAGEITLDAMVRDNTGDYANISAEIAPTN